MARFIILFLLSLAVFCPQLARAAEPERVIVGAHINDIQEIDLQSHSYRLDAYVWFRWHNPAFNPAKSAEFMNAFDPADHVRTPEYDKPQKMPDGSLYMIIRDQGKFSAKFPLQKYPFDQQQLAVAMEDSVHPKTELVYVPDTHAKTPVTLSPHIYVPGFTIGAPDLTVIDFDYPTDFGDISQPGGSTYSRAMFSVPIARPQVTTGIKVFLPVALIILCTALVFFVHPAYIEGRLGVAITALLTLVALQLTTASSLPEVDYLLMTDKIYLLSYLFILATLTQIVRTSRQVQAQQYAAVETSDRQALRRVTLLFLAGVVLVALTTF